MRLGEDHSPPRRHPLWTPEPGPGSSRQIKSPAVRETNSRWRRPIVCLSVSECLCHVGSPPGAPVFALTSDLPRLTRHTLVVLLVVRYSCSSFIVRGRPQALSPASAAAPYWRSNCTAVALQGPAGAAAGHRVPSPAPSVACAPSAGELGRASLCEIVGVDQLPRFNGLVVFSCLAPRRRMGSSKI